MLVMQGPGRHGTERRLEPNRSAAARRNAHRAAAIASVRKRAQSRRDCGRGSTAGAAGRVVEAPRIMCRTEETVFGGRPRAELGEVGLAEDRAALFLQARYRKEIDGQRVVLECPGAKRQRIAR